MGEEHLSQASHQKPDSDLSGALLMMMRFVWLVISFTAVVIVVTGIITLNQTLQLPCELSGDEFCLVRTQALQSLNISQAFRANWLTVGILIETLPLYMAGVLIFWYRSHTWFGLLLSLSVMLLVIMIDPGIITWTEFAYPTTQPLINFLSFVSSSLFLIWFFFPDGEITPRWLVWLIAFKVIHNFALSFLPGSFLDTSGSLSLHLGINYSLALLLAGVFIYRYRYSANRMQRQQIKWVVTAALFLITIYIIQEVLFLQLETQTQRIVANFTVTSVFYLSVAMLALSIMFAVFRYRLFDIDAIIRRTVQYTAVSTVLIAIYYGSVILLQRLFTSTMGEQSPLIIVFSTLVTAALFNPLRTRLQTFVDRRFYRQKYDAQQILAQFAQTARDEVSLEVLTAELGLVVQETLQPDQIFVWIKLGTCIS